MVIHLPAVEVLEEAVTQTVVLGQLHLHILWVDLAVELGGLLLLQAEPVGMEVTQEAVELEVARATVQTQVLAAMVRLAMFV